MTLIFISNTTWEHLSGGDFDAPPLSIHFSNYSKEETLTIVKKSCPKDQDKTLFSNFLLLIIEVFRVPCNNLSEFKYIVDLLFPKYIEPIQDGKGKLLRFMAIS
jgi:origin recognition complex subunit 5